ncbi:MAG TPA: acetyl-CoA carboxylase carboxyltransferase subunit alpha [Candidatus Binataceae bacterium]|jgi:acetyl-CoA carboxylase carboxyl transferase subunit alpha|nr:acetyl-CoA carboxylase carboxyltransferase subunit alpha [Candidatus Binataceae bacterium]
MPSSSDYMDFEQPLRELDQRAAQADPAARAALIAERERLQAQIFANLSAIDRVHLARHPARPQTLDYVGAWLHDFVELHGDRRFGDDGAIVAGVGYFKRQPLAIVGHQRGRSTAERIKRNFGRPNPEGYRKAARIYELASRFRIPLATFIDTQGAEPGIGAEERGQAEAIARNLELMSRIEAPVIACVIGEGGSGGALALGVADVILMQEYACYSVITPEGCAAILWRTATPENVGAAATALRLAAPDLERLGIADEIVPEPPGGAHRNPAAAAAVLGKTLGRHLARLVKVSAERLRAARDRKFAAMGSAFVFDSTSNGKRPTRSRVEKRRGIG